jgi:hypothetical protein
MNTNQFLQTARTVTFLIQKNKASIPNYDSWYDENVIKKWASDEVMKWAKDSRNKIEKEGDLELNSSMSATLIFSYIESEDISIPCTRSELLGASVKKLVRFARQKLPTGISDVSTIKIERKWIAKSLEKYELLHALTVVYSRIYSCCSELSLHLSDQLEASIPKASDYDQASSDSRHVRYLTLNGMKFSALEAEKRVRDVGSKPPQEIADVVTSALSEGKPNSLLENVQLFSKCAKATFDFHGNHVPMLFFFDENWKMIDFVSAHFSDTASKYIFWRSMAERVLYTKPSSIVFICEAWTRTFDQTFKVAIRNMPITGEFLQIMGLDRSGNIDESNWVIKRNSLSGKPTLEPSNTTEWKQGRPAFLAPIVAAFSKL